MPGAYSKKKFLILFFLSIPIAGLLFAFDLNRNVPDAIRGQTGSSSSSMTNSSENSSSSNEIKSENIFSQEYDLEKLELELNSESQQQDEYLYQVKGEILNGGAAISAAFEKTSVRQVISVLATKAQLSIVISPSIEAEVSAQFKEVPSKEALRSILQAHKLYFVPSDNILQIVSEDEYRVFAQKYLISTRTFRINWSSLRQAITAVKPYMTRGFGKMSMNARTQSLIISDLKPRLDKMAQILQSLDVENQQVMITARIIEIQYSDSHDVGTFFNITEQNTGANILSTSYLSSRGLINSQQSGGLLLHAIFDDIFIPSPDFPKTIELRLAAVGVNGEVNTVASPRILVQDNTSALIQVGSEIPYPTSSTTNSGQITNTFQFLDAGTKLQIIPQIVEEKEGRLRLQIQLESSTAQLLKFSDDGNLQAPQKNLTRSNLTALCKSGQTLLIAGFISYVQIDDKVGIPILKDIPLLDFLFSNTVKRLEKREVAILITPKIMDKRGTPIKKIYQQLIENSE